MILFVDYVHVFRIILITSQLTNVLLFLKKELSQ